MKHSTLGSYIRSLRTQNHLTQSQLAEKLNVTDKAVSKWERDLSYPDIALFPKIADILGVNVNDLLSESIEEGEPSRLIQIFEMSPDFRAPLHIIMGCADMAAQHYEDKEMVLRYLQSIRISGEYLLENINRAAQVLNQEPGQEPADQLQQLKEFLKEHISKGNDAPKHYDFSDKRILVAEDMELNREIAGEILKQTGAKVDFAEDGQICVDKLTEAPSDYYDLILMDIMMPNLNGIETTKRIRRLPDKEKASIPIIAVSANVSEKDRHAAQEAGMDAFTEKPIFVEKLFATMKQHLQE